MASDRWIEVTPSQFAHETEGLRLVRDLMPDRAPFRVWTNFEFRDHYGRWAEVDLLLLAPDGLHLVELKYYSGRLHGTDQTWQRDGRSAEDSPLRLANSKAKRLRSLLMGAYAEWLSKQRIELRRKAPAPNKAIPFITASVFLHHPDFICELPEHARKDLYGLPDNPHSGLPPVTFLFQGAPFRDQRVPEAGVIGAMRLIGLRAPKREAGSYVLDPEPFADGPGWQDWLGTHKSIRNQRRRVRFRVVPAGASQQDRERARKISAHELQVMQRLSHDAILRPEDYVDSELGPGLIYPYDPRAERLDLWLAGIPGGLDFDTQLLLIRQVGEALQYAHGKHVVHRNLNPHSVLVRPGSSSPVKVQLTGWQGVGRTDDATRSQTTLGVTTLAGQDADMLPDEDRWVNAGFSAPEGAFDESSDRLRLDVFGLGALAFYLVSGGVPPARTQADLSARLRDQKGLDVSVEVPTVSPKLREAILAATRPSVSKRLPDVAAFLALLDAAEPAREEEATDPLDARPGDLLDDRFELVRRLGSGSTAVGLLVRDRSNPDSKEQVLKVARDASAAGRLEGEADVLLNLDDQRVVKLVEGPLDVGGRRALLLESAGPQTLASELGNRERLSLDWLERWGTDLLETVALLDAQGVMHRDIKPSNLGIRERPGRRMKHLVLFDFSLSKAPVSDVQAGTRPYLDPFLPQRRIYDSAAERYAAAVVLFEMATGHIPVYGDGLSDPSSINDEATISPANFDPSVRAKLTEFFTKSLARDASRRHDTAEEMLLAWRACFPASSVPSEEADRLVEQATEATPLPLSGLSPRALSALEPLRVATVGDLAKVDAGRLNHLPGSSHATRNEVKARAKLWRSRFGSKSHRWVPVEEPAALPSPHDCADELLAAARKDREDSAVVVASHLLGVTGSVDPLATQAALAASLTPPVTPGRVSQIMSKLHNRWASNHEAVDLLSTFGAAVDARLAELGGVATFDELAEHLLALMVSDPKTADSQQHRLAAGLLRHTIDRRAELVRAEADELASWVLRRRENQPVLLASDTWLLDLAEALGRRAESLVAEANLAGQGNLVPADRAVAQLSEVVSAAKPAGASAPEDQRLSRLAAMLSPGVGSSATGELHDLSLLPARALQVALRGVAPEQRYTADDLRDRVSSRFPDLPRLPKRPHLDAVVSEADVGLRWEESIRAFVAPSPTRSDTTGLLTRPSTALPPAVAAVGPGAIGQRLLDSRDRRSFLALGVGPLYLDKFRSVLREQFDGVELDLSGVLLDALHETAERFKMDWAVVLDADAADSESRPGQGLRRLIAESLPAVDTAIDSATESSSGLPLVLLDASLLARYDALGRLSSLMDLSTRRKSAVWLVVPQLHGSIGPIVDGRSLPLTAPNQYVQVPSDWVDAQYLEGSRV